MGTAGKGGPRSKLSVCLSLSEQKHCLLELGARGVRELVHSEVYPIVIHVEVTEKNVREIRRVVAMCGCPLWKPLSLHLPPVCLSICVHACIIYVYCGYLFLEWARSVTEVGHVHIYVCIIGVCTMYLIDMHVSYMYHGYNVYHVCVCSGYVLCVYHGCIMHYKCIFSAYHA